MSTAKADLRKAILDTKKLKDPPLQEVAAAAESLEKALDAFDNTIRDANLAVVTVMKKATADSERAASNVNEKIAAFDEAMTAALSAPSAIEDVDVEDWFSCEEFEDNDVGTDDVREEVADMLDDLEEADEEEEDEEEEDE